ncbi:MAG TPA: hypothetical protein VHD33_00020 [Legionellaceae bacterium]|nr:hypothetical protein [Legionellaceae bacterium]
MKSQEVNPFGHLAQAQEIDGAEIIELIEDDITDKVETLPEFAHLVEEETHKAIIHALGAAIDSMAINGISAGQRGLIIATAIELLKSRRIYDLKDFSYTKSI